MFPKHPHQPFSLVPNMQVSKKFHISHYLQSQTYIFPKNHVFSFFSSKDWETELGNSCSNWQLTARWKKNSAQCAHTSTVCVQREHGNSILTAACWLHRSQLFCLTLCNIDEARGEMLGYVWLPFYIKACSNIYAPHRAFTAGKYTNINIFSNSYVWLPSI